ncbi:cytochrome P450 [Actinokineospora globicatena]|uniref:Cytochrome P450 n=1 Tax=Actinokineospora globicatena TaxID=103729 RepID=A0A9W6QEZ3_9PSEU|nr:cytochrome P450 [Actinokineospora globicatena]MCP2303753.1 Cytochrome P450 [Actinokineospora globicatena]GLW79098.1 cytochrome P450 [Actinokineospora globicatena]GLW86492.1 cytochrome P450 [Actinokineospora globicatena]GLW89716.1 cytochrome P450 [Actinokineospora globicatena]
MTAVVPEFPMARSHPLDPPPQYRSLSRDQPVVRVATPRGPAWLVTRHEDCTAVLTDPTFSSDPRTPGFPSYMAGDVPPPPGFFLQLDPPDQPRLRRLVTREFLVGRMEALRPRMREVLDELVDGLLARGTRAELVADLAYPMAATMICELLDVPTADQEIFVGLTDTILDRASTPEQTTRAAAELMAYFDGLVTAKKQAPKDDLFGRLIRQERDEQLTHEELVGLAALLLLSGYDTMAQMIGLGVLTLLEHPDQLAELRADPSLMPAAVEEMMRYLSINHAGLPRAATADVVVGGQLIKAGDGVLVMLNAANRDAAVFADPDVFDIHRAAVNRHIGFGHGFHKCIGLTLARVELTTVFTGLFDRIPGLRVPTAIDELPFRHDMVLYGVRELPVEW